MSLFVLDTDHLTLYQRGHPAVVARVRATTPNEIATTIISIEEQLRGWYTQVRQSSRSLDKLARAYQALFDVVETARRIQVLPFSRASLQRCFDLRKTFRRLDRMDLSIAA